MALSVIVCDDSKFARKQLIRVLPKSLKENLQEAGNGEEALNIIRNGFGELMFLDLNMPVMDGYEVLKRLRAENRDILVIVLTGDVQKDAEAKILSLADKYASMADWQSWITKRRYAARIKERLEAYMERESEEDSD